MLSNDQASQGTGQLSIAMEVIAVCLSLVGAGWSARLCNFISHFICPIEAVYGQYLS